MKGSVDFAFRLLGVAAAMLTVLVGCGTKMKKYDWLASESAHPDFPMKLVYGAFIYPDKNGALSVPNGKIIHDGWGKSISVHVAGPNEKPLPERLNVTYYSYVEDEFFQGEFSLPYDEIVELFSEGYNLDSGERITYKRLVAGFAPGGQVAVWLQGIDRSVEIYYGKAQPVEYDWTRVLDNPSLEREEYRRSVVDRRVSKEKQELFIQQGIPFIKFDRFRDHYPWAIRFFRMSAPTSSMGIEYLNGEKEEVFYRDAEGEVPDPKLNPAPRHMAFRSGGALFYIHFDEDEMIKVFEEMANGDDPLYFDIAPGLPQSETRIRLRDKDGNHTAIENFTVEEID